MLWFHPSEPLRTTLMDNQTLGEWRERCSLWFDSYARIVFRIIGRLENNRIMKNNRYNFCEI